MPATESLLALTAFGPALFKSYIPATAALSTSGAAAVPTTSVPAATFAVTSAAGGGAASCGLKSVGTALLLAKKGGATVAAKAGSGFLSLTKGAAAPAAGGSTAAGGSAASLPASAATPAGPNAPPGTSFSSYSPGHIRGTTPVHHFSPHHSHASGLGAGNGPHTHTHPPGESAGGPPAHGVRQNPVSVVGDKAGGAGPQPGGTHHPWHRSPAGGAGEASNTHTHRNLQTSRPQPTGTGRSSTGVSRPNANRDAISHSRRVRNTPVAPVSATDPPQGTPAAAPAEQAGGEQSAGSFIGAGSNETTVISTLLGIALLRWAFSSLCFGRNTQQGDAPIPEATAAQVSSTKKSGFYDTKTEVRAGAGHVKRQQGHWSGRRVERWKRDTEFFIDEDDDLEHAVCLSRRPGEVDKDSQSSKRETARTTPLLEVCLSEREGDETLTAQGEAIEILQEFSTEWLSPDPPHASEQLLNGSTTLLVEKGGSGEVEKNAGWPVGGSNARQWSESQSHLEGVSDTTVASSGSANELPATSGGLTKKKQHSEIHEVFCRRRSGGRLASFL